MKPRSIILIVCLIFIAGVLSMISSNWKNNRTAKNSCLSVTITTPTQTKIEAEVADTPAARTKGLSQRDALTQGTGMLFTFPTSGIYPFWMKNTRIALDIIWIKDHSIVEITTLEPESADSIPQHTPKQDADSVLELNKGEADKLNLKPGSKLAWDQCW